MGESAVDIEQRQTAAPTPLPPGWLSRYPWATFVVPLAVYMLVGSLEPTPPKLGVADSAATKSETAVPAVDDVVDVESESIEDAATEDGGLLPRLPYRYYPAVYSVKIALTCIAMLVVLPGYRTFPFRVSWLAFIVGATGVVLWVGICKLELEERLLVPLGLGSLVATGERSAFNPLAELRDNPAWAYGFLAIRLFGLAVVVPIIEEFFLRGFLMRFVMHDRWELVPFGSVNRLAVVVGTAVPMLLHPAELLAALVWFSLVTWLMVRNRNIWDCVVAHAVTNLLLGVYVIATGDWHFM